MAAFLFLLLLSSFQTLSAQQRQLNISLGSSISPQGPNSSWLSASGLFAFGFYRQGVDGYAVGVFVAGIPENTSVWTANRENPVVPESSTLQLTTDGRLLLLGQEQNKSVLGLSNPSDSIATASMLDSGNFVLYNSVHSIIWQSFDYPTISLLPGQRLLAEKEHELISSASETDDSKGTFLLKMQKDGYLVQYPVGTPFSIPYAYWQPLNVPGLGEASSLSLDKNGRLYLSNSTFTHVIFPGGTSSTVKLYLAKVDVDGIFRLYSHSINQGSWTKEWESLSDECAPKGVCGFNSYCIRPGTEAVCECLPGFDFLDETNKKLGCVRNSTVERCKQENGRVVVEYDFRPSQNVAWVASPYAVSEKSSRAECQDACRDDCNCQVVFFDGRNCTMQKLPLRFGRRNLEESTVALIKVSKNVVGGDGEEKTPPTTVKKKEVRLDILIPSVSFFTVAVLILVICGVLIHQRRVWEYKLIADSEKVHLNDHEAPQAFTYAELQQATNDFKEKLGEGAFGHVYKGYLPDRQKEVAVKRLEKVFAEGGAEMEFQNELRMIGKTHHRNLVRLLGFCLEGHQRLLVYEYMNNGSLANLLFEQKNRPSLKERIALALDIARGILYLHEECEAQIIHCDIKPQNILLDKHWRARISDFGLAKLLNYDQTKTYTRIRGTKGYAAPEWHKRLPVTVKADVYSYGIVLLEILCGRRSVETSLPEDEIVLEYWAYTCFETGNLKKLVGEDDEEEEEVDKTKLERMIKIAIWCIQDDPSLRPSIKKVMLMLEGTVDIPIPPSPTSILSTI